MDTAIITGTTRGLGKAMEAHFIASGWSVLPLNRPDFDLNSLDAARLVDKLKSVEATGRVVLVNNAATHHIERAKDLSRAVIEREIVTNISAPITLISEFLRVFPQGEVVNITSVAATTPIAHWSLYGTAKAAMNAFLEHLKAEGVKCFNLNPGAVATDMQVEIANSSSPLPPGTALRDPAVAAKNLVWQIARG